MSGPYNSPMTAVRRFLVLQALLAWQGGFLFYSAAVVPVGTRVLGSRVRQGQITAGVTEWLNLVGVLALAVLAWELVAARDPKRWRSAGRWWCWGVAAVAQHLLFAFHQLLDYFMSPDRSHIVIRPPFYLVHTVYLWASTAAWVAMLLFAWWTVRAWAEPRSPAEAPPAGDSGPAGRAPGIPTAPAPPR